MTADSLQGKKEGVTNMTKFEEFEAIIARLRAPDGCPWDRELVLCQDFGQYFLKNPDVYAMF